MGGTKSGHVVSCWNIRSPELVGNLFEMHPAESTLVDVDQRQLLRELMLKANGMMLAHGASNASELMKDVLPDDFPLKILKGEVKSTYAGPLEHAPLLEKHKEGLVKFFTPRL